MKNASNTKSENQNYMTIVDRNSQQLLRLIDDILDLTKVEAGMITIEKIEMSLTEMLDDITVSMEIKAAEQKIYFRLVADSLIPDLICTDPFRIRQIFANVVGNAFKFTTSGEVSVNVSYQDPTLTFIVRDTGVGISPEQGARLFQPFAQADVSTTRRFGGSGLGLVLSRRLAEILGGKLELVSSAEGVGSVFIVQIRTPRLTNATLVVREKRVAMKSPKYVPRENGHLLSDLKVLLVEDAADNQLLINTYLRKEGAAVTTVADGEQAVKRALKGFFDVILMDIQMPVLDGHEATIKLRQAGYLKPIIALTAHAMIEEQAKCFESGFNEFLTKPVERNRLIELLSRYKKVSDTYLENVPPTFL